MLTICPKTHPMPYPFMECGDPDQLRDIAFGIEDGLRGSNLVILERPGLLFIRSALLDLADRIDRDG